MPRESDKTTLSEGSRSGAPFFQSEERKESLPRRLLLISFHFPPGGAAGSLRWQKLSRFAAERGWALDVISLHPSALDKVDNGRLQELPPGTRVYGVPMPTRWLEKIERNVWRVYRRIRPAAPQEGVRVGHGGQGADSPGIASKDLRHRFSRDLRRIVATARRGYFAWMDYYTYGAWADEAAKVGFRLLDSESYQVIVTCGPPHMAHETGRRLAQYAGLPLVVDLRDPWRLVQRLADSFDSPVWYRLASRYERRVVEKAALIVMNTARAQKAMQAIYPWKREQIIAVMNGFDEEPLKQPARAKDKFTIAYAGVVYLDRDPRVLLKALAATVTTLRLTPGEISMEFMGHVQSYQHLSMRSLAEAEGVADFVHIFGPGPRDAALEFLSKASVLVSLPQDSDMAIPSKVFEYMQFDAWILAIAQKDSATESLLRGSDASVVAPDDLEGMTGVLTARFKQYRNGARPSALSKTLSIASRRAQAALLFDAIDDLPPVRASNTLQPRSGWTDPQAGMG
jgi:glycosyltransferase involved in cell wall biosynthesis